MTLLGWFILIFFLGFLNMMTSIVLLHGFFSRTPSIGSTQDLEAFKQAVRCQMYLALLQLGIMILLLMLGTYGVFTRQLSFGIVLVFNLLVIAMSRFSRHYEVRARSMPVNDESLRSPYNAICQSWTDEPIPRF